MLRTIAPSARHLRRHVHPRNTQTERLGSRVGRRLFLFSSFSAAAYVGAYYSKSYWEQYAPSLAPYVPDTLPDLSGYIPTLSPHLWGRKQPAETKVQSAKPVEVFKQEPKTPEEQLSKVAREAQNVAQAIFSEVMKVGATVNKTCESVLESADVEADFSASEKLCGIAAQRFSHAEQALAALELKISAFAEEAGLKGALEEARSEADRLKNQLAQALVELRTAQAQIVAGRVYAASIKSGIVHVGDTDMPGQVDFSKPIEDLSTRELLELVGSLSAAIRRQRRERAEESSAAGVALIKALATHKKELLAVYKRELERNVSEVRAKLQREYDAKMAEKNATVDEMLKERMEQQTKLNQRYLEDLLHVQEITLAAEYKTREKELLITERAALQQMTETAQRRLDGLVAAVKDKARWEHNAKRAQLLWLAAQRLQHDVLKVGSGDVVSLGRHLSDIDVTAGSHPYVSALLTSVEPSLMQRGVTSEGALRRRFTRLHDSCLDVANVLAEPTLTAQAMSYVRTKLLTSAAPVSEKDSCVFIEELDNYKLLASAKYWVQNNDLEQAVRFMSQLKGQPATLTGVWLRDTRELLEIRQLARALSAFAVANTGSSLST